MGAAGKWGADGSRGWAGLMSRGGVRAFNEGRGDHAPLSTTPSYGNHTQLVSHALFGSSHAYLHMQIRPHLSGMSHLVLGDSHAPLCQTTPQLLYMEKGRGQ